jgi:hypothetical protein
MDCGYNEAKDILRVSDKTPGFELGVLSPEYPTFPMYLLEPRILGEISRQLDLLACPEGCDDRTVLIYLGPISFQSRPTITGNRWNYEVWCDWSAQIYCLRKDQSLDTTGLAGVGLAEGCGEVGRASGRAVGSGYTTAEARAEAHEMARTRMLQQVNLVACPGVCPIKWISPRFEDAYDDVTGTGSHMLWVLWEVVIYCLGRGGRLTVSGGDGKSGS